MDQDRLRGVVIRTFFLVTSLLLIYVIFNYSFTSITVNSKEQTNQLFLTNSSNVPEFKVSVSKAESKRIIIKRGTRLATVRAGDAESRLPIKFRPVWSGSYNIDIKDQVEIKKLGSNTLSCGINSTNKVLYSYRCSGKSDVVQNIVENNFPTTKVVIDKNKTNLLGPAQYLNGILSVTQPFDDEPYELSRIILGDTVVTESIRLPNKLNIKNVDKLKTVTNVTDNKDPHFLLVDSITNKLYIFKKYKDTEPVTVDLQNDIKNNPTLTHSCSLGSKFIACIYTQANNAIDKEINEEKIQSGGDAILTIYSLNGEKLSRRTLKENGNIYSIAISGNNIAALTANNELILYHFMDGSFVRNGSSTGVDGIMPTQNLGLLVLEGSSVYSINNTLQTNLLLRSTNLRVSDFASGYGSGLFTAFTNNQRDSRLSTYELTDRPQVGDRIIDKLPTSRDSLIRELDYLGDTLYIRLALTSYTSDQETGEFTVDEAEFNATKNEVLRQLKKSGLDSKFKQIVFSY